MASLAGLITGVPWSGFGFEAEEKMLMFFQTS